MGYREAARGRAISSAWYSRARAAACMQGYWYHRVCRKAFHECAATFVSWLATSYQRSDFPILQQQNRAGHGRRISAETSNEIKVIRAERQRWHSGGDAPSATALERSDGRTVRTAVREVSA